MNTEYESILQLSENTEDDDLRAVLNVIIAAEFGGQMELLSYFTGKFLNDVLVPELIKTKKLK